MPIRVARPDEAEALTDLCLRSKAAWGYDAAFMAASNAGLTLTPSRIAHGLVWVAEDSAGAVLGVAALAPDGGAMELDLLFVEPFSMRAGTGRALLAHAAGAAALAGARHLTILADPNAAAFYERCGARRVGDAPSDAIPGRMLPLYVLDLAAP
ncbi:MAG: GNAT family N-acetyltransferase [Alphaproteobacteria bacterium]|nr:GNAT family N-acetyltransferase [Alphaproteobacteria bacterium]